LTSDALAREIERITGQGRLAFYDSISPIVETDSIDMERVYLAARWDKGTADYINCPMTREEYDRFLDALLAAEPAETKDWEKADYFEGCLPIEVLARRGRDTLRFGPMKPVGLRDPRTGLTPWAVVQLRQENLRADSYNLVGFQNHLKWGDQARVLRLIPGLENARFLRYGQIHRNTYIQAPLLLDETLSLKTTTSSVGDVPPDPAIQGTTPGAPGPSHLGTGESAEASAPNSGSRILFAGQLSGIEGYTESIATGLLVGLYAAQIVRGFEPVPAPRPTALGSLVHYITHAEIKHFQPANMTFDLLVPLEEGLRKKIRDKKERHRLQCEQALAAFDTWWAQIATSIQDKN
jgi:methylenetetrahydrofolate--tRNA-(uracil-5-)-methyltransferase